jgi:hypothetical protein
MRQPTVSFANPSMGPQRRGHGHARVVVLVLACLFLGFAFGAWWHYRTTSQGAVDASLPSGGRLSEGTRAVLKGLDSPIEIRFYSLLDPGSAPDSLRAFAGRVDQLLSEFENEAHGRINLVRRNTPSDPAIAAAASDGIRPFILDNGDACYLGITIAQDGRKESISQISQDWEPALESDLSRAIARVVSAKTPAESVVAPPVDPAIIEEVKRAIPDPASISLEEGTRMLREKALTDLAATTQAMETQAKEVEQRFLQAQSDNSEAAQQAARKELQQIRARQTDKAKQIAARLHDQIAALERLKSK